MMGFAGAILSGMVLGLRAVWVFPFALGASALLAMAAIACSRRARGERINVFLHAALLCLGIAAANLRAHDPSARAAYARAATAGGDATVIGVVADEPVERDVEDRPLQIWRFVLRLEGVRPHGEATWRRGRGDLHVAYLIETGHRAPSFGERWQIELAPAPARRDGAPRGGSARNPVRVRWRQCHLLSGGHGSRLVSACLSGRQRARELLSRGIEDFPDVESILHSLLLGYRERLSPALGNLFRTTGTFHIFAISGLHVGLFAGIVIVALGACRVPRMQWVLYLAPSLIAYTLATGMRPSAVRACVMAIVFFAAPLLRRREDGLSAVALAAILITAWDPGQIAAAGFVLSFVVVTGLILFYPVFAQPLLRLAQRDPMQILPEARWARAGRTTARYAIGLLAASCAAWLSAAPLTAYYFGGFAPVAIAGNLVVIPLTFLIVLGGCLSLVLGSCVPLFADIYNHANLLLVKALIASIRAMGSLPFGYVRVNKPHVTWVLLYYALLLLAYAVYAFRRGPDPMPEEELDE